MKTIGLLGGTGWASTIGYYKLLNELVAERLGGYHSAKVLLKSIDYHDIMTSYGKNHQVVAELFKSELAELIALKPDCIIICCNSLHKYYDMIKTELNSTIPVMHAVELAAEHLRRTGQTSTLLLATKFTMDDGFFAEVLNKHGINVTLPAQDEQDMMQQIHAQLMHNVVSQESRDYFSNLITKYHAAGSVILGCTEYPLVVDVNNSGLPIIDPVYLQVVAAANYALS